MRFSTVMALLFVGVLMSCEKKEDTPESSGTACNDAAFCMDYGTVNKSGNATLSEPPGGRYRIYWENTSGSTFEQVELDIYASATGSYSVDTNATADKAVFQYFSNTSGTNNGVSGTVNVTQFDPNGNGLSGDFMVTTQNGTKVTNGHFVNVKK